MYISSDVSQIILKSREMAVALKHEYILPEHVLIIMCDEPNFKAAFENCGGDIERLKQDLKDYLEENMEPVQREPIESFGLQQAFNWASQQVANSGKDEIQLDHLFAGIMHLPESYCSYFIAEQGVEITEILYELCHIGKNENFEDVEDDQEEGIFQHSRREEAMPDKLAGYLTNLNELVRKNTQPLVGREDIINRTIQVLCRKQKNNPIHLGEPGVGKTMITLGLAKMINEGKVPEVLKNAEVFELDLGAVLAGTQYRGDFEKRLKGILDLIKEKDKPIVYIDEIHNIVGAGALGGGSLDASNLLKPYLTQGKIRFIGATTYSEYKKYLEKDKALIRRFQTIEVKEPTVEETIKILQGIRSHYEAYHKVKYTDEAIEAAAKLSSQYINDRFLPDKAIDLLDEAGAYYCVNYENQPRDKRIIDLSIIETTLSHICKIPKQEVEKDERQVLEHLEENLKKRVFGQDEAVTEIVKSIKLSRAGFIEDEKPVASLLFVGPTGVGKTELARALADELGIKLVRFDMSEYVEKHTASKLIGAPPGYVGYEEGGLLTEAIRKTPYCVLLLDEIEKAHQDIYNVLLQIMDYATLTDNQGRKADFRNVILIMTSNAGASKIGKKLMGFGEREIDSQVIDEAVKKTFTPEFRNRLTKTVVFKHLTDEMAKMIVRKHLNAFKAQLQAKNVEITFTPEVEAYIAQKGISAEYGARQIQRIIDGEIKPVLVDAVLFGALKEGGKCSITLENGEYKLIILN